MDSLKLVIDTGNEAADPFAIGADVRWGKAQGNTATGCRCGNTIYGLSPTQQVREGRFLRLSEGGH